MTARYSEEFKEEALAMARETSVSNASAKLGVSTKAIYSWRQQKRLSDTPETIEGDLETQNKQLRRELDEITAAASAVSGTVISAASGILSGEASSSIGRQIVQGIIGGVGSMGVALKATPHNPQLVKKPTATREKKYHHPSARSEAYHN